MPDTWFGGFSDVFLTTLASWPLSVNNEQRTENSLEVYPNPAKAQFSIKLLAQMPGDCLVQITDVIGRQVYQNTIAKGIITVQVSNWAKGMYFVQAGSENGNYSGKIIIE